MSALGAGCFGRPRRTGFADQQTGTGCCANLEYTMNQSRAHRASPQPSPLFTRMQRAFESMRGRGRSDRGSGASPSLWGSANCASRRGNALQPKVRSFPPLWGRCCDRVCVRNSGRVIEGRVMQLLPGAMRHVHIHPVHTRSCGRAPSITVRADAAIATSISCFPFAPLHPAGALADAAWRLS